MSIRACHYQASEIKICTPNADGSSLVAQTGKNPPARRETWRGEQHPLQYSSLEKSTGGEAWRARMGAMGSRGVHGVPKNRTWLSNWHVHSLSRIFSLMARPPNPSCPLVPGLLTHFCCCFFLLFWLILGSCTCWFFPWNSFPLHLFPCPLALTLSVTLWMVLPY